MLLIYLISTAVAASCFWFGQAGTVRLDHRSASLLLRVLLSLTLIMTAIQFASVRAWVPETLSGGVMSAIYAGSSGLIFGMTLRLYRQKAKTGDILYTPRTFWSDHGLDVAALLLILFGLYRTTLFQDLPATPIRITSGISLIAIGIYSWILRPVPELRRNGVLFLDRVIPTSTLLSARWEEEQALAVDYQTGEFPIQTVHLHIPEPDERREADRAITRLLDKAREIRGENERTGISA